MIRPTEVIALDEVADDLNEGRRFYSEQEVWLGNYFWDSLLSDIESLYLSACVHAMHAGYYRSYSKRFPYAVYYEIEEKVVRVVAVLPMRRDPAWIKEKLSGRH